MTKGVHLVGLSHIHPCILVATNKFSTNYN